jgi:hypothetical protein
VAFSIRKKRGNNPRKSPMLKSRRSCAVPDVNHSGRPRNTKINSN